MASACHALATQELGLATGTTSEQASRLPWTASAPPTYQLTATASVKGPELGAEPAAGHSRSAAAAPPLPPMLLGLRRAWAWGPEERALARGCRLWAERAQLWAWAGAGARAAEGVLFFTWVVSGTWEAPECSVGWSPSPGFPPPLSLPAQSAGPQVPSVGRGGPPPPGQVAKQSAPPPAEDVLESYENPPPIVLPSEGFQVDLEGDCLDASTSQHLLYLRHFLWGLRGKPSPSGGPAPPEGLKVRRAALCGSGSDNGVDAGPGWGPRALPPGQELDA